MEGEQPGIPSVIEPVVDRLPPDRPAFGRQRFRGTRCPRSPSPNQPEVSVSRHAADDRAAGAGAGRDEVFPVDASPPPALIAEAFHGRPAALAIPSRRGRQMGDLLAVARDGHRLAAFTA